MAGATPPGGKGSVTDEEEDCNRLTGFSQHAEILANLGKGVRKKLDYKRSKLFPMVLSPKAHSTM